MSGRSVVHLVSETCAVTAGIALLVTGSTSGCGVRLPRAQAQANHTNQKPRGEDDFWDATPRSPVRILRYDSNMQIAFDTRTRNPVYVLERLDINRYGRNEKLRRPNFFTDSRLPPHYQSRNEHYVGSGFDRGHMAPAADFSHDKEAFIQTFSLANSSPQHADLNRGIWAQLEAWTRRVAQQYSKCNEKQRSETFVVTGPLWLPSKMVSDKKFQYEYEGLGRPPQIVAVPTHFFKVVVVATTTTTGHSNEDKKQFPQIEAFACFVVPNQPNNSAKPQSLSEYLVCWTDLEAVTGLEFFPNWRGVHWHWKLATNTLTIAEMQGEPFLLPSMLPSEKTAFPTKALRHLCSGGNCSLRR